MITFLHILRYYCGGTDVRKIVTLGELKAPPFHYKIIMRDGAKECYLFRLFIQKKKSIREKHTKLQEI